jgi:hypothetical protein
MQIFPRYRFSLRGLLLFVTAISVVLGTYSLFEVIGASLALAVIGGVMYQTGMKYNNIPFLRRASFCRSRCHC